MGRVMGWGGAIARTESGYSRGVAAFKMAAVVNVMAYATLQFLQTNLDFWTVARLDA